MLLLEVLEDRIFMDAQPVAGLNAPTENFIEENFEFEVTFDNTGDATGYGPFVDLVLEQGIDVNSVTYNGAAVTTTLVATYDGVTDMRWEDTGGNEVAEHPYDDSLAMPGTPENGDQWYILEAPFGSFVPDQPEVVFDVNATLDKDDGALVGSPLDITVQGGFRYGQDALDNPLTDAPLQQTPVVATTITPTVMELTKTDNAPESERATGPNYAYTYTLTVDIADGQTLTDLTVTDLLPNNLVYVDGSVTIVNGAGGVIAETPVSNQANNAPDNDLQVTFASITGTAASNDIVITYEAWIPEFDADGAEVLNPDTGAWTSVTNTASATADYDHDDDGGASTADMALSETGVTDTVTAKPLAIQKGVSNFNDIGGAGYTPGDTLEYTLNFQVSDYFSEDNLVITDVTGDGQLFDGTFTPTYSVWENGVHLTSTFDPANYTVTFDGATGETTIAFDLAQQLADDGHDITLAGDLYGADNTETSGTRGTIVFHAEIQEDYAGPVPSGDQSVDMTDSLTNDVDVDASLTHNGNPVTDASSAGVTIAGMSGDKTIYAVNGVQGAPAVITPGDLITYRVTFDLSSMDTENFTITDYLPLPIYDSTTMLAAGNFTNAEGTVPAVGHFEYGTSHTLNDYIAGDPSVTTDGAENSFTLDYGTFDLNNSPAATVDILFTVEALDQAFADGLYLTNQVQVEHGNTVLTVSEDTEIVQVLYRQPELNITKSVVSTDNANLTDPGAADYGFSDPGTGGKPFADDITSAELDANPLDHDLDGVDAGDIVRFTLVVENTGGDDAWDVSINDAIPAGFAIPGGGLNLTVYSGDGTALTYTGADTDLFTAGGITLDEGVNGAIPGEALDGSNIVIITYELQAQDTIVSGTTTESTAEILTFGATDGGTDFTAGNTGPWADNASVSVPEPTVEKSLVSTSVVDGPNAADEAVIGETVQYSVTVTVVEGETPDLRVVDTLEQGLQFVSLDSITASGDLSTNVGATDFSDLVSFSPSDNGQDGTAAAQILTFDLGDITNANRDNGVAETITFTYTARVLNIAGNQDGTELDNAVEAVYNPGAGDETVAETNPNDQTVTVIEPDLDVDKTLTVNGGAGTVGDAGDPVVYTVVVDHHDADSAHAYDLTFSDALPGGLDVTGMGDVTVIHSSAGDISARFEIAGGTLQTIAGQSVDLLQGETLTITVTGTVGDTVVAGQNLDNTATITWSSQDGAPGDGDTGERTGSGGVNDYTESDTAPLSVGSPSVSKVLTSTSINTGPNENDEAVIGETATYTVTITLTEGDTDSARFVDTLEQGLQFVSLDSISRSSGDITTTVGATDFSDTVSFNPTVVGDGTAADSTLTFDLGDITNANRVNATAETITLVYTARVLNVSHNVNNEILINNADFTWNNGSGDQTVSDAVTADQELTVIEPNLQAIKNATVDGVLNGAGDAGDSIVYEIVLSHRVNSFANAYDVTFSDAIPADVTVSGMGDVTVTHSSSGDISGLFEISGGTLQTQAGSSFDLLDGETVTITISGTLANTVVAGSTVTNQADIDWSSIDGNGLGDGDTGERTGSGGVNDYSASGTCDTDIHEITVDKTLVSTSINAGPNANDEAVIGETAQYSVTVTVVEGDTDSLRLVDTLDQGFQFVSLDSISRSSSDITTTVGATDFSDLASFAPTDNGEDGTTASQVLTFDLGDVSNVNNNDGVAETITLTYTVQVLNIAGNQEATVLDNSIEAVWNNGAGDQSVTDAVTNDQQVTVIEPDLDIAQTVTVDGVLNGIGDKDDTVVYEITIDHNNVNSPHAYDLTFSDTLPAKVDVTGIGDVTVNHSALGDITTNFEIVGGVLQTQAGYTFDLLQGQTVTVTINGTVASSINAGETVTNEPEVSWSSLDGAPGDGDTGERTGSGGVNDYSENVSTSFTSRPGEVDKQLTATSINDAVNGLDEATIGETAQYTVTLTIPQGNSLSAEMVDTLDVGLQFVSFDSITSSTGDLTTTVGAGDFSDTASFTPALSGGDGTAASQVLTFDFGDITNANSDDNVAETITLTYTVLVLDIPANTDGDVLDNDVEYSWNNGVSTQTITDGDPSDQQLTVVEPDVNITKTVDDDTAAFGQTLTYTVEVQNTGNATAQDIEIVDTLPVGLTYVPGSASLPPAQVSVVGQVITFTISSLDPGTESFTYQATVANEGVVNYGDVLTNTQNLTTDTLPGVDANERDYSDSTTESVTVQGIDYAITKDDGAITRNPGEIYTYTVEVTNNGNTTGTGVTVTDTFDPDVLTILDPDGGTVTSGQIVWNVGNLASGASQTFTIQVQVAGSVPAGVNDIVNTATVTDDGTHGSDPDLTDNTAVDTDALPATPDLAVTKDDFAIERDGGEIFSYTITVVNNGNQDASGVQVTDTFDPALLSVVDADGGTVTNGRVVWNLGDLAVGASHVYTLTMQVSDHIATGVTDFTNTVTVADDGSGGADPTPGDNTDTDTDNVNATPDYQITKDDGQTSVSPGETFTYTITVENIGSRDGTGVVVTDLLPDLLEFVSADNGGVYNAATGIITWNLGNLDAGDTQVLELTVRMPNSVDIGVERVTNPASVTDDGTNGADPTPNNNRDTDTDVIDAAPDYVITKDDGLTEVDPGDQFTYTITVQNAGNQDGTGVTVVDVLPTEYLSFVSTNHGGVYTAANGHITWDLGDLDAGQSTTITLTVMALDDVRGEFTNIVSVHDDGANGDDPTPDNNTAIDTDSIGGSSPLVSMDTSTVTEYLHEDEFMGWHDHRPTDLFFIRPTLSVSPIYSGMAEPGTTIYLTLFDAQGDAIGQQTVVADVGGNWMATFPGCDMYVLPHHMVIQQTQSMYNNSTSGFWNLRTYFSPAMNDMMLTTMDLSVDSVFADMPDHVMEHLHGFNIDPLRLGWDDFWGYEFMAISVNPAQMHY